MKINSHINNLLLKHKESLTELKFMKFSGMVLYTPKFATTIFIRNGAEAHLRSKFSPGTYFSKNECNEIIQNLSNYHISKIDSLIKKISIKSTLSFLLFQFEQSEKIDAKYKDNLLTEDEKGYWEANGPTFRQTIDFFSEKCVQYYEENNNDDESSIEPSIIFDLAWLHIKKAIEYSNVSNLIHMVLPNENKIVIYPKGNELFISHEVIESAGFDKCFSTYRERAFKDLELRSKYIIGTTIEADIQSHVNFLDAPMYSYLGISYSQVFTILAMLVESVKEIHSPKEIPMVNKKFLFTQIVSSTTVSWHNLEKMFDAITLNKSQFINKTRNVWDYKQTNRMSKRPLLEINQGSEPFFIWSNSKLKGFLTTLNVDLNFKQFPPKWINKDVQIAIDKISNKAGKWFEKQLMDNFEKIGVIGGNFEKVFTNDNKRLHIEKSVGGIDFLGFSLKEDVVFLIECKMINSGFEAKGFRQELFQFRNKKKGFLSKIKKKSNWIKENFDEIFEILSRKKKYRSINKKPTKMGVAIVTHYVNIASCFIDEVPCVTLPELFEKYKEVNKWPFTNGIIEL